MLRKLGLFFVIFFLLASIAHGADSITVNGSSSYTAPKWSPDKKYYVIQWDWSNTDGACSGGTTDGLFGWVMQVKFIPDSANPPDADYAVTITDANGYDFIGGVGASLDGTSITADGNVRTPLTNDSSYYALFGERLTVNVSGTGATGTDEGIVILLIQAF